MSKLTTAALGLAGLTTAALVGWGAPALADHGSDDPAGHDAARHAQHHEPGDDHGRHHAHHHGHHHGQGADDPAGHDQDDDHGGGGHGADD